MKSDIKRKYIKWTDEDIKLLVCVYLNTDKYKLEEIFIGRSWVNIKSKANSIGLKRESRHMESINGDITKLLRDEPISYYYIGFILADGNIHNNRLRVRISEIDTVWMIEFARFLNTICHKNINKHGHDVMGVGIMDTFNVTKLQTKFDISCRKTYNPPLLSIYETLPDALFMSMFIGFIDGDGCISYQTGRNDCSLHIKIHKNWLDFLNMCIDRLSKLTGFDIPQATISNAGYAHCSINRHSVLKYIKSYTCAYNLPVLDRKWVKIDMNHKSRTEITQEKIEYIINAFSETKTLSVISRETGWSISSLSQLVKRHNLRNT